jgi:hypothetical protein
MIDETFRTAQGPPLSSLFNPVGPAPSLGARRELIRQSTCRHFAPEYPPFYPGTLSCVLSPLIPLLVCTFIFSVMLQIKGGARSRGQA